MSTSCLRLKNSQGTTIGIILKKNIFFQKQVFGKKTHIAENPKKKTIELNKRFFLQTENNKNFKTYLLIEFENFWKHVA